MFATGTAWDIAQLLVRRRRTAPSAAPAPAATQIAMGVTMAFMFLIAV
jgi:hypothetical protein